MVLFGNKLGSYCVPEQRPDHTQLLRYGLPSYTVRKSYRYAQYCSNYVLRIIWSISPICEDKGFCLPTIVLWLLLLYLEGVVRWRNDNAIPYVDFCRPFAAHWYGSDLTVSILQQGYCLM